MIGIQIEDSLYQEIADIADASGEPVNETLSRIVRKGIERADDDDLFDQEGKMSNGKPAAAVTVSTRKRRLRSGYVIKIGPASFWRANPALLSRVIRLAIAAGQQEEEESYVAQDDQGHAADA
jgi:hypothetical protein